MQRIQSLDLARGFTVLLMPSIHVAMVYSIEVQQSILGNMLAFMAEWPGAQLFMLLMGIYFTFSYLNNRQSILRRAFYFLIAAYVLNFLKFLIPLWMGWMPDSLMKEVQMKNNLSGKFFFFCCWEIYFTLLLSHIRLFIWFANFPTISTGLYSLQL